MFACDVPVPGPPKPNPEKPKLKAFSAGFDADWLKPLLVAGTNDVWPGDGFAPKVSDVPGDVTADPKRGAEPKLLA